MIFHGSSPWTGTCWETKDFEEKPMKNTKFWKYKNEPKFKTTERFSKFLRSLESWERVVDGISLFFMMGKKCDTASFSFCMHILAYKIIYFLRRISPWKVAGWALNGEIQFSTQERCKLRYSPCIPENLTRIRPLAKLLASYENFSCASYEIFLRNRSRSIPAAAEK